GRDFGHPRKGATGYASALLTGMGGFSDAPRLSGEALAKPVAPSTLAVGRQGQGRQIATVLSPLPGLSRRCASQYPRLTPWATVCRPGQGWDGLIIPSRTRLRMPMTWGGLQRSVSVGASRSRTSPAALCAVRGAPARPDDSTLR